MENNVQAFHLKMSSNTSGDYIGIFFFSCALILVNYIFSVETNLKTTVPILVFWTICVIVYFLNIKCLILTKEKNAIIKYSFGNRTQMYLYENLYYYENIHPVKSPYFASFDLREKTSDKKIFKIRISENGRDYEKIIEILKVCNIRKRKR